MKKHTPEHRPSSPSPSTLNHREKNDSFFVANGESETPFIAPSQNHSESHSPTIIPIQRSSAPEIQLDRDVESTENEIENFTPGTGSGILNGEYQPGTGNTPGRLIVTLRVHLIFSPTAQPGESQDSPTAGWTPLQQDAYRANYQHLIERAWSNQHIIQRRRSQRRRGRSSRQPIQRTEVQVRMVHSSFSQADFIIHVARRSPHLPNRDLVAQIPEDVAPNRSSRPGRHRLRLHAHAYDRGLRSTPDSNYFGTSNAIMPLRTHDTVFFGSNSFSVDAMLNGHNPLRNFAQRLRDEMRGNPIRNVQIEIKGYANGAAQIPTAEIARISLRRAIAVRERLSPHISNTHIDMLVIPMGGIEEETLRESRKVEISARRSGIRRTAIHEGGHLLGLGDEYVEEGREGQALGNPAAHSQLAQDIGLAPVLVGRDPQSIMAGGDEIRPQHYVTFARLLAEITNTSIGDWEIV